MIMKRKDYVGESKLVIIEEDGEEIDLTPIEGETLITNTHSIKLCNVGSKFKI